MRYGDNFLIEKRAGTVYDGRVSHVKRKGSLIDRIQMRADSGPIWYCKSGRAGPRNGDVVCFSAARAGL